MNNFQLHLYNTILPIVSHVKSLVLYIDSNLTWRKHVDFICNNVSSLVGLFNRIRKFLNHESKILFYNSYILPCIDYCLTIRGHLTKYFVCKTSCRHNFKCTRRYFVFICFYSIAMDVNISKNYISSVYINVQYCKSLVSKLSFNVC